MVYNTLYKIYMDIFEDIRPYNLSLNEYIFFFKNRYQNTNFFETFTSQDIIDLYNHLKLQEKNDKKQKNIVQYRKNRLILNSKRYYKRCYRIYSYIQDWAITNERIIKYSL